MQCVVIPIPAAPTNQCVALLLDRSSATALLIRIAPYLILSYIHHQVGNITVLKHTILDYIELLSDQQKSRRMFRPMNFSVPVGRPSSGDRKTIAVFRSSPNDCKTSRKFLSMNALTSSRTILCFSSGESRDVVTETCERLNCINAIRYPTANELLTIIDCWNNRIS